jgi:hypothetical protein
MALVSGDREALGTEKVSVWEAALGTGKWSVGDKGSWGQGKKILSASGSVSVSVSVSIKQLKIDPDSDTDPDPGLGKGKVQRFKRA